MKNFISVEDAEFETCGADTCRLLSVDWRLSHFKVPSSVFSDGKRYRIIGLSSIFRPIHLKSISFDENSEVEEVYLSFIRQVSSIFTLPPRIKRVRCPDLIFINKYKCPAIVCRKGGHKFVSTAGKSVIMNYFPLDVACQQSRRERFTIRETVRFVGDFSFSFNKSIRSVVFPSSVECIFDFSFYMCSNLRFIHFKNNSRLKKIGNSSFLKTNVERLAIPSSVEEIGHSAFSNCWNLISVAIPEDSKLKIIGCSSFSHLAIESIVLPSNVEEIGINSFSDNRNLRSVKYQKKSKIRFERDVFSCCPLLIEE